MEPGRKRAQPGDHREQPGRRDHRDAVGHHQRQLVRRLDLVRAAQQVRHRRVLGRDPEQRADLDQQGGDEQPPQRADQRDRQEQPAAQHVARDHDPAAVELVGERAGERTEHQRRQELGGDDAAEREALRLVAGGELGGQGGQGEQAQPVARRRDGRDQPQATERGDGEDAADPVRRRAGGPRRRPAGGGPRSEDGDAVDTISPTSSTGRDAAAPGGAGGPQGSRGARQLRGSARRPVVRRPVGRRRPKASSGHLTP